MKSANGVLNYELSFLHVQIQLTEVYENTMWSVFNSLNMEPRVQCQCEDEEKIL